MDNQTVLRPAPGAHPALGMMVPTPFVSQRVCGHEYHEAIDLSDGEMQYCACDTGAIGRCAIDHRPVCGYHSALREGRRLCTDCVAKFDADAANAKIEVAMGALRPRLEQVRAACTALADVQDSADRLLVLLQLAHRAQFEIRAKVSDESIRARAELELRQILTHAANTLLGQPTCQLWDVRSNEPALWTFIPSALIGHWRQTGRLREDTRTKLRLISYKKTMLGGTKPVTHGYIDGWQIRKGRSGSSDRYGSSGAPDVYVLADGTLGPTPHTGNFVHGDAARQDIGIIDLLRLSETNHLIPLNLPPSVTAYLAELAELAPLPKLREAHLTRLALQEAESNREPG